MCLRNSSCYWNSSLIQHNVHIYLLIWDLLPTSLSRTVCYLAVCRCRPNWTELHENLKRGMGFGGARMPVHILYSFSLSISDSSDWHSHEQETVSFFTLIHLKDIELSAVKSSHLCQQKPFLVSKFISNSKTLFEPPGHRENKMLLEKSRLTEADWHLSSPSEANVVMKFNQNVVERCAGLAHLGFIVLRSWGDEIFRSHIHLKYFNFPPKFHLDTHLESTLRSSNSSFKIQTYLRPKWMKFKPESMLK